MPWKVESSMSIRKEFISFAGVEGANIAALCRQYRISRKTGYKWLGRSAVGGEEALTDRSRRPLKSPRKTEAACEKLVVDLRTKHPAWGARKLRASLELSGHAGLPARSTVNDILHRHGLIDPAVSQQHVPHQRFERPTPNDLWQIDFKGHFATVAGRCHPLGILDDHSRFNLLLRACDNEQLETVRSGLTDAMRQYGMPLCILSDNGPPWGSCSHGDYWTKLGVWLIRLGVRIIHGRPRHPQTQGKQERFHRSLNAEVIGTRCPTDLKQCQELFDQWRPIYNHHRPHEALQMQVPASRYQPSSRAFPEKLPTVQYADGDTLRIVSAQGQISYKGTQYRVGTAFAGTTVAVRNSDIDGQMDVFFNHQRIAEIDLRSESVV